MNAAALLVQAENLVGHLYSSTKQLEQDMFVKVRAG